ncbi:hypothetical protein CEXT_278041 [Caerostris extrusa]|uniref:Uncharacterized protein n=1 Tax=Caerostris extrusa TaxID=172846 RepID=A0AAV4VKX1_CAEEX|nr:hypothetical protein CEXT_278041 [Caerostris extrusa]
MRNGLTHHHPPHRYRQTFLPSHFTSSPLLSEASRRPTMSHPGNTLIPLLRYVTASSLRSSLSPPSLHSELPTGLERRKGLGPPRDVCGGMKDQRARNSWTSGRGAPNGHRIQPF